MEGKKKTAPLPEEGFLDGLYRGAKATASLFPGGGTAAELLSAVIVPPVAKRRDEWLRKLECDLRTLEDKVECFTIQSLQQNNLFLSAVLYATQLAMRSHQKEKLDALRNAVLNVATANAPDEDLQLMFLNLIDTFTPWHLRLLRFFCTPKTYGVTPRHPDDQRGSYEILEQTFPDLKRRRVFCDQIVKDLAICGLVSSSVATDQLHGNLDLWGVSPTDLADQFLTFITSPLDS